MNEQKNLLICWVYNTTKPTPMVSRRGSSSPLLGIISVSLQSTVKCKINWDNFCDECHLLFQKTMENLIVPLNLQTVD